MYILYINDVLFNGVVENTPSLLVIQHIKHEAAINYSKYLQTIQLLSLFCRNISNNVFQIIRRCIDVDCSL